MAFRAFDDEMMKREIFLGHFLALPPPFKKWRSLLHSQDPRFLFLSFALIRVFHLILFLRGYLLRVSEGYSQLPWR